MERIRKESKRISSLIVKDVFGDYSTAKSVPSQTLESIQVGMPLKRIEMAVESSANVGHIVAIDGTDVYIDLTEEEIWPKTSFTINEEIRLLSFLIRFLVTGCTK